MTFLFSYYRKNYQKYHASFLLKNYTWLNNFSLQFCPPYNLPIWLLITSADISQSPKVSWCYKEPNWVIVSRTKLHTKVLVGTQTSCLKYGFYKRKMQLWPVEHFWLTFFPDHLSEVTSYKIHILLINGIWNIQELNVVTFAANAHLHEGSLNATPSNFLSSYSFDIENWVACHWIFLLRLFSPD